MLNFPRANSIYIHIPFCSSKCAYCDFYSVKYTKKRVDQYWDALFLELAELAAITDQKLLQSIYIGGGTPSVIKAEKYFSLLNKIKQYFKLVPDAEITIEVNPASITAEKLIIYRRAGINRLSVGIQSLNDKYLSLLGRKSNRQHNLEKLTLINRFFNNYSTDLIFAIPGQTLAEFKKDLSDLLKFEPPHISLYNLELHPGTKLYQRYQADKLEMPTEELDAEMYDLAAAELKKAAYNHYEISNYARQGYRARHNFIYWLYQPYLAAGPGAVSFNGNYRFQNKADLKNYLLYYGTANSENILEQSIQTKKPTRNSASEFQVRQLEKLTAKEKQAEFAFLALRTERGILLNEFQKRFKQDFKKVYQAEINSLKANQLIKEANNRIYLTNRGKKLANEVFIKFLP